MQCPAHNNTKEIKKILIANRGEIATRIIKTARRLGIPTVAIYSDVDVNAPFVHQADEAIHIPGTHCHHTYINIEKVIQAAHTSGADAIHPGYGFLSENAVFARQVENLGITFIGPSADSIDIMGDKIKAKNFAVATGINVVPGFVGSIDSTEHIKDIIATTGLPVIIKATAGGGGKGMRIVYDIDRVLEAITTVRNEAKKSFGDDRVFIEKFIENPRHIEIQIAADKYGNIVCLGERECSIQRFNQKVIEESPSPCLDKITRQKMYDQSIKLVAACNYHSVGTVEFIMGPDQQFYFLEMNTRLQVEHTVTEYVTKMDLVELMIHLSQGKALPITQEEVSINGWAIETRICAEDPAKKFLPSIGRITQYTEPTIGENVRVDSGVTRGSEISPFYDAMIGKLITFGSTRNEAIKNMRQALGEFVIEGIATNLNLLEHIMHHDSFVSGDFSTGFMQKEYPNGFKGSANSEQYNKVFLLYAVAIYLSNNIRLYALDAGSHASLLGDITILIDNKQHHEIQLVQYSAEQITIKYQGETITYSHDYKPGKQVIRGTTNAFTIPTVKIKYLDRGYQLSSGGVSMEVSVFQQHIAQLLPYVNLEKSKIATDRLLSPISGIIVKIKVEKGMTVATGQELLVIEAMKMENTIYSETDTVIKEIAVKEGAVVAQGDPLLLYS